MLAGRVRTAVTAGLREYRRTPVLLAVLVVAPAYLVGLFGVLAPETPVPVEVPGGGRTMVPLSDVLVVLGVVLTSGLVGGIVGLFVVQSAADADGRLVVADFEPVALLLARGTLVGVAALGTVAVALPVALVLFDPVAPVALALAAFLTALTYGMVGIVVGSQVDRLAGVWTLVFVPLLDVVLFQNPLATETEALGTVLPGYSLMRLATDAAFATGIEWANLVGSVGYLAVTTLAAAVLYHAASR